MITEEDNNNYDNLSDRCCSGCGVRLLVEEFEEFEDECFECVHSNTSGIIEDTPERGLDDEPEYETEYEEE